MPESYDKLERNLSYIIREGYVATSISGKNGPFWGFGKYGHTSIESTLHPTFSGSVFKTMAFLIAMKEKEVAENQRKGDVARIELLGLRDTYESD